MRPHNKYLELNKVLPLCRLLAQELPLSPRVQKSVIKSLVHWWINSTDETVCGELRTAMVRISHSSCSRDLAKQLADVVDSDDSALTNRTLEVLAHFRESTLDDASPRRIFRIAEYQRLHDAALNATTAAAKGDALEELAEYIFLCVPGLNTKARNLRTLTEEIDLAFSNQGNGFWREVGNPFIVECRNLISPVEAKMVRDFVGKMRTKAMRTGFIVTTNRVAKTGVVEQRQALRDGLTVVSLEGNHLSRIATFRDLLHVFEDRYFTCRLL